MREDDEDRPEPVVRRAGPLDLSRSGAPRSGWRGSDSPWSAGNTGPTGWEREPIEIGEGWHAQAAEAAEAAEAAGSGPPWHRRPVAIVIAAIAGLAVGYLAGTGRSHDQAAPPPVAAASPTDRHTVIGGIVLTGAQCSHYEGHTLQVGAEVTNVTGGAVTVTAVAVDTPGDGLQSVVTGWGTCGELTAPSTARPLELPAGGTAWLSSTFHVTIPCPGPIPVLFTVTFSSNGSSSRADQIGGFNDLGGVPYPGCSVRPS